ncbi:hypothetical protein DFQ30_010101, partial [Apophysomyces sp. BC1015]
DSEEVRVFCLISNVLRPFVPRGNARNIPALCLPFIVLADALLGVTGYPEFARNICPMVNPAHVHALNVDAVAIYEILGSAKSRFNLYDERKETFTSTTMATQKKGVIFNSFFDTAMIQKICSDHGQIFQHRMMLTPHGTAMLMWTKRQSKILSKA